MGGGVAGFCEVARGVCFLAWNVSVTWSAVHKEVDRNRPNTALSLH